MTIRWDIMDAVCVCRCMLYNQSSVDEDFREVRILLQRARQKGLEVELEDEPTLEVEPTVEPTVEGATDEQASGDPGGCRWLHSYNPS